MPGAFRFHVDASARHGFRLWQIQEWHSQFSSSRSGKSKRLCAPGFRYGSWQKQPLHTPFPSGYQFQTLNALGVELAGSVIQTAFFRRSRITFNCSSPFAIASLHGRPRSYAAYILAALYESPRIFTVTIIVPAVQTIQRCFTSDSLASRNAPCSAIDSCRCDPLRDQRPPGPAASYRPDGYTVYRYAGNFTYREQPRNNHTSPFSFTVSA